MKMPTLSFARGSHLGVPYRGTLLGGVEWKGEKKITTFSAQKFLQGKNKDRTVVGHIKKLLGLLEFHPPFGHFEFVRRLGST